MLRRSVGINMEDIVYWNTDTQFDFMRNDEDHQGTLYVARAEIIEPNLEALTNNARAKGITIINTGDAHTWEDVEVSKEPDMVNTFPMHCERYTKGAKFIPATRPNDPYVVDFQDKSMNPARLNEAKEILLYKNHFGAFEGNPYTGMVVDTFLKPKKIVQYGVATNVCVDYAVMGNVERAEKRGAQVYVVTDAIMGLPHLDKTPLATAKVLQKWKDAGVKFVTTKDVLEGRL
jgi:nicotinamidase/pyrazinamidase